MARMKRLYAPYIKKDGKWIRATITVNGETTPLTACFKDIAVRRYQTWLLAPFTHGVNEERELRPIPLNSKEYDKYSF